MKMNKFLLLSFSALLLTACGGETQTTTTKTDSVVVETTPEFETREFLKEAGDCKNTEENACLHIAFTYPEFVKGNPAFLKMINQEIISFFTGFMQYNESGGDTTLEIAANSMIAEWQDFQKEMPDASLGWYVEGNASVVMLNPKLLSLSMSVDAFTGGAHPNATIVMKIFNLQTNQAFKLEEIVSDVNGLTKIAEGIFRQQLEIPADASLEEQGFEFENNTFALNDNYMCSPEGLVFIYNTYEIAPYAAGSTEIVIPWNKIEKILTPAFREARGDVQAAL
jgi:hypothetical protein